MSFDYLYVCPGVAPESKAAMKRARPMKPPEKRDAVAKSVQLLWLLVEDMGENGDREWGVRELAEKLNFRPTTVYRSLTGLMRYGLVQQNESSGKYSIGVEVYRLALMVQPRFALRNAAMPFMQDLVAECNEAALLGLYDSFRMQMMFVAVVDSSHPLRYIVPINEWISVHAGATGLAVMAFLPEQERRAIVHRYGLPRLTEATITDADLLEDELARIRARGYAFSRGQRTTGSVAIAAPIWGPTSRVIGDLGLTVPELRFEENMEPALAKLVVEHARRITENLVG